MQQSLGVFGYLEMDAGQGGDFGFYILLVVRLEFGNYPTLRFSSLTGDFVPLIGNPGPQGMYGTVRLSVSGFAYFRTDQRHGVRNRSVSDV